VRKKIIEIGWMTILFLLFCLGTEGQNTIAESEVSASTSWKSMLEEMAEQTEETDVFEEWSTILSELAENPIELNSASIESLESIPFLSESQVEGLSYYLYRYGPMENLSEILLIEGMDEQTLRWLTPFVCLGKKEIFPIALPPMKKAFNYGKQELRFKIGRSLQEKAGYKDGSYQGDPMHILLRYGFNYKSKMQWGVTLEKDPGESLWQKSRGVDYASFHFMLKDQKRFQSLLLGDYQLRFGQGLICSGNFSMGKSTYSTILESTGAELSRHFSVSESGYFRGIAIRFLLKPYIRENLKRKNSFGLSLTPFVSIRKLDAKTENNTIYSLYKTGLHRTESEIASQNKVKQSVFGVHFALRTNHTAFGFSGLTYHYDRKIEPEWKPYNQFYFTGKQGSNFSIDFRFFYRNILCFGETAWDEEGKPAFLSGLSFKPLEVLSMSMLYRDYAPAFHSAFGNAFSESSGTRNEQGLFSVVEWTRFKKIRLNAYFDVFRFPWLQYDVNAPSCGQEYALQCTYTPTRFSELSLRFKTKKTEKSQGTSSNKLKPLVETEKNQLRLQCSSTAGIWNLKTNFYNTLYLKEDQQTTGFSLSQDISVAPSGKNFSCSIRYTCFDAEAYENRIYSWEKDLPGSFCMPMLYGKGSRYAFFAKIQIQKKWSAFFKIAHSIYDDRSKVGSGSEEVKGNRLTEIRAMINGKF
jgi:hypothetical protein